MMSQMRSRDPSLGREFCHIIVVEVLGIAGRGLSGQNSAEAVSNGRRFHATALRARVVPRRSVHNGETCIFIPARRQSWFPLWHTISSRTGSSQMLRLHTQSARGFILGCASDKELLCGIGAFIHFAMRPRLCDQPQLCRL